METRNIHVYSNKDMKIALDISPLSSGHKVRGVGFYLHHLKDALVKYFPENEYIWFEKLSELTKLVDVVHFPYFDPFTLTLPLKRSYKTVVTVHDLTPIVFPQEFPAGFKGMLKWRIQRLALKSVDGVITDSECSRKDVMKLIGMPAKKVSVAYLAAGEEFKQVSPSEVKRVRQKYHLPEKFALYVGDVTANKNVPRIMKAAIQANIPLVMVGKALAQEKFDTTSPWNKDLVEVKFILKQVHNILLLGFVPDEDLVALYNSATLAVMPSIYEGFGLPVVEAMQSGCPVVSSHGGSLAEVTGEAAYVVDPLNIDNMAEGLSKVFYDEKLQMLLQKKGLQQAKKFSWQQTAADTLKVYERVLAKK